MHTDEEILKSMFEQSQVTEEELAKYRESLEETDFHVTLKDLKSYKRNNKVKKSSIDEYNAIKDSLFKISEDRIWS